MAVVLVRGDDPVLVADAARERVDRFVGSGDRSLSVTEFDGEEYALGAVVDAARTPPFLTERRVVVARDLARFGSAEAVEPLVEYLGDEMPTTDLVLVWPSGRLPKPLTDALKSAGAESVSTTLTNARAKSSYVDAQLAAAPFRLDAAARKLVASTLGEDVHRIGGLVETLAGAFGSGASLGVDDVQPLLGASGSVAPWDLTDAIDRGDRAAAIENLHRMLDAGDRHELQVMALLQTHYGRLLRLDGAGAADDATAAALLGMKGSTFPAKKARELANRMGSANIAEAITLLSRADVDLRGASAWPGRLVLEVLVARLSRLSRRR